MSVRGFVREVVVKRFCFFCMGLGVDEKLICEQLDEEFTDDFCVEGG